MRPIVVLATFASSALAANTWIGCVWGVVFPPATSGNYSKAPPQVRSKAQCEDECQNSPAMAEYSAYSYYLWTNTYCWCGKPMTQPPASRMVSPLADGTCPAQTAYMTKLGTTFSFSMCGRYTAEAGPSVTVPDVGSCFTTCKYNAVAAYQPASGACACLWGTPEMSSTCGPESTYYYTHAPDAAASGLVRRHRAQRAAQAKLAAARLCPRGFQACRTARDADEFECIDTNEELVSCGGCLFGSLDDPATQQPGTNCSDIAGVDLGGVTCAQGSCRVSACEAGWELDNGVCTILGDTGLMSA